MGMEPGQTIATTAKEMLNFNINHAIQKWQNELLDVSANESEIDAENMKNREQARFDIIKRKMNKIHLDFSNELTEIIHKYTTSLRVQIIPRTTIISAGPVVPWTPLTPGQRAQAMPADNMGYITDSPMAAPRIVEKILDVPSKNGNPIWAEKVSAGGTNKI